MVSSIFLPSDKSKSVKRRALIYYICGNPGLIEYYTDFLANLHGLLRSAEDDTAYDIYGRNLLGFFDEEHEPFGPGNEPWDLEGQIEGIFDDVAAMRTNCTNSGDGDEKEKGTPYDAVVLMGHSVGAYMAVEIVHRHMKTPSRAPHLNLQHGILLFPTLTHIAQSPSGTRIEFFRRSLPLLDTTAHVFAKALLSLFSMAALTWFVQRVMGFTPRTASVTARWLKSRDGVQQSLFLGVSELRTICEEKWEEELWEGGKWFVFYAREDHWVAGRAREEFVRRRGDGVRIVVDEGDIPHAFCTREDSSWAVARRVEAWIGEIERSRES